MALFVGACLAHSFGVPVLSSMLRRLHAVPLPLVLVLAASVAWVGCDETLSEESLRVDAGGDASEPVEAAPDAASLPPGVNPQAPYAYDDATATQWLASRCAACHGVDAEGVMAPAYSSWGMSAEFSVGNVAAAIAELQTSSMTPTVYQTIYNSLGSGTVPSPMPPTADGSPPAPSAEERLQIARILGWLYTVSPMAVAEAEARYGSPRLQDLPSASFDFHCATPASRRRFLSNFTYAAFDRPPTPAEVEALGPDPDAPVSKEERLAIVGTLRTIRKDEFLGTGLRKLARYIGGAGGIEIPNGDDQRGLSAAQVSDLKDELYALYRRHYDETAYDDFFRSQNVAVTANTAPLYGCVFDPDNATSGWSECAMPASRKGFFTTLGFLGSKPSSFLEGNNNYGRVASMYFTIFGETLRPDTAGPTGGEPKALPECLEQDDLRYMNGGPIGSAAVATFGAICQTCHVSRAMAAGSVLFRRFSQRGLEYTADMFAEGATPAFDGPSFETATAPDTWAHGAGATLTPAELRQRLASLLTGSVSAPNACIPTGRPDAPTVSVSSVDAFADYYLRLSDAGVARAFGRHANRAFANSNQITFELAQELGAVYTNNQRTLPDLVETYFASETFACTQTP